jgi:hypothetical protein
MRSRALVGVHSRLLVGIYSRILIDGRGLTLCLGFSIDIPSGQLVRVAVRDLRGQRDQTQPQPIGLGLGLDR